MANRLFPSYGNVLNDHRDDHNIKVTNITLQSKANITLQSKANIILQNRTFDTKANSLATCTHSRSSLGSELVSSFRQEDRKVVVYNF